MPTPVYIASSSMIAQRQRMDVVADNVANVNTSGYKKQSLDFAEVLSRQDGQKIGSFAHHAGSQFNFSQGSFQKTGNTFDLALRGEGFFAKEVNGQQIFTRNGQFSIDAEKDAKNS